MSKKLKMLCNIKIYAKQMNTLFFVNRLLAFATLRG